LIQDEGGDECRRGKVAKVDGYDHRRAICQFIEGEAGTVSLEQLQRFVEIDDSGRQRVRGAERWTHSVRRVTTTMIKSTQ
jgi:hypothetical protein